MDVGFVIVARWSYVNTVREKIDMKGFGEAYEASIFETCYDFWWERGGDLRMSFCV